MWVAVGLAVVGLTMNLVVILINRGMPARVSHDEISDFVIKQGSDGIRLDVKGNLYTTHGNKVHVYNADGKLVGQIEVPENPANLCFGGDDFKTLFITARTSLYSVRVKVAGAKPKGANW
jgi:sugar lactone lactonase YvrE